MPKQKYYYAVVEKVTDSFYPTEHVLPIYKKKKDAAHCAQWYSGCYIKPIPADSLHNLIKEHTKKAK